MWWRRCLRSGSTPRKLPAHAACFALRAVRSGRADRHGDVVCCKSPFRQSKLEKRTAPRPHTTRRGKDENQVSRWGVDGVISDGGSYGGSGTRSDAGGEGDDRAGGGAGARREENRRGGASDGSGPHKQSASTGTAGADKPFRVAGRLSQAFRGEPRYNRRFSKNRDGSARSRDGQSAGKAGWV